jgi:short subunit dehydrogenase-like uncharacterized protein
MPAAGRVRRVSERPYDIVLFGATGFTGQLTAEYLAEHAPRSARIALAGRNLAKLEGVASGLSREFPLLVADSANPASLLELASATSVVVTTVGPYLAYGEPLVAACAQAGTGYLDLTGEPEFVDQMYLNHHARAVETGARLVHACGFDSIPYDLGCFFAVNQLPEGVPIAVNGYMRMGGTFSGGTYHSAVGAMSRLRSSARVAGQRRRAETAASPLAAGRRVHGAGGRPHNEPLAGGWVVPVPTIDPQIVLRSARALERYGPDFSYGHYIVTKSARATGMLIGGAAALVSLSQLPPTRALLLKVKGPGDGPDAEQRAKSRFTLRLVADAPGAQVVVELSGGDPGYGETAKMLSEAALCMAFDDIPVDGGQLTTAVAFGQPLVDRLAAAGLEYKVVSA